MVKELGGADNNTKWKEYGYNGGYGVCFDPSKGETIHLRITPSVGYTITYSNNNTGKVLGTVIV